MEAIALSLSPLFEYSIGTIHQPVVIWVTVQMLAGICYVYGCSQLGRLDSNFRLLVYIVLAGAAMRALMFFSTPALETDFYRYLWDGAMLASGHNPYSYSPAEILSSISVVPHEVQQLAVESHPILDRVNHPQVTTIYPLVSSSVFALAYLFNPWSIDTLRSIYLVLDVLALCLLAILLRSNAKSLLLLFVFWCNPLLVRLVYNSLHMDIVVVCLVCLVVFGIARRSTAICALALGAAIGAKIWPVLVAVHLWVGEKMPAAAVAGLGLGFAILLPLLLSPADSSGFLAYSRSWEVNDPVFRFVSLVAQALTESDSTSTLPARGLIAVLFILCLVHIYRTGPGGNSHTDTLLAMVGLFLVLLPAPYPWYFLWLSPFLVLQPVTAWIFLTVTLPLYDLRFYFEPRDMEAWFDYVIVPIEFSPLLLLLSHRQFRLVDPHVS